MRRERPVAEQDDSLHHHTAMVVKSVRLPSTLWARLDATVRDRTLCSRRDMTVSWLIRALLERGLDDPDGLPAPGKNVARPQRVLNEMAARQNGENAVESAVPAETASHDPALPDRSTDANDVYARLQSRVVSNSISFNRFFESICGDRKLMACFYHNGRGPNGPADQATVDAVRAWLEKQ